MWFQLLFLETLNFQTVLSKDKNEGKTIDHCGLCLCCTNATKYLMKFLVIKYLLCYLSFNTCAYR